jgi:putative PIG3 family NAD(P)H quinone oxidoreductase
MRAMRAMLVEGRGNEARLVPGTAPDPKPGPGEVVIAVRATAVNRADLLQRRGLYPPPPGASDVLGLECAGVVHEVGAGVSGLRAGDRAMALLAGGGYAELAAVHAGSVMAIPERLDFADAAAIPEVFLTCHLNLFRIAGARAGDWVLVHGGGSGIGTAAIQLLKRAGASVIVTCGGEEKAARCRALGADVALDYRKGPFAPAVLEATGGRGAAVVLDSIGAPYLEQHLACMEPGGRLVLIGLMGGAKAEIQLGLLLAKRLSLIGSTLRTRPVGEKAEIVHGFLARFGDDLASGALRPIVHATLPLERAQQAHEMLEKSEHFGKVVLVV